MISFDVYPRMLTLFMILPPALYGISLRPVYLFPCIPLIYRFVEAVIHRTILYQMFLIAETKVVLDRLEVFFFATKFFSVSWYNDSLLKGGDNYQNTLPDPFFLHFGNATKTA